MTASRRFTGLMLAAAMLLYGLAAPVAIAVDTQTTIGVTSDVGFDATGLPNGATYDLTVDGSVHHVTAGTGNDVILQIASGTYSVSWSAFAYNGDSTRFPFQPADPAITSITVSGDMQLTAAYGSPEYLLTFDQTGLPTGTHYYVDISYASAIQELVAGTPYSEWDPSSALNFAYQPIVYNDLGAYELGSLNVVPTYYVVQGPANIIGTYVSGDITGTVFLDTNGNHLQDPGEPGIAGVTVELLGQAQNRKLDGSVGVAQFPGGVSTLMTTISGGDGTYSFDTLPAGTFYVRATLPDGSQQESGAINLVVSGGSINSGEANFPEGVSVAAKTLPYTGR
jgi:hypothetical protein